MVLRVFLHQDEHRGALLVPRMLQLLSLLVAPSLALEEVASASYLALPAATKASRIWTNCLSDTSPAAWLPALQVGTGLLGESMCPTFRHPGDQLPLQGGGTRPKVIHTVGSVGRVEWRSAGGHNYTGLFQGATQGIVRMSLAMQPDPSTLTTAPGIGLKFLRDGMDSANLVAMYSVDGQESWNFFKNDFSNHIPGISLSKFVVAAKFATGTRNIRQVGISDWAKFGESGAPVAAPSFPYRLRFHPTGSLAFPDTYVQPTTEALATIPVGSTLYQVFAMDGPEELGGSERRIGELVLVSEVVASSWGDQQLFFRHQDMAEDLQLRPKWNDATPQFSIFKKDPNRPSPCPV